MNTEQKDAVMVEESSPDGITLTGGTIVNGTNLISDKLVGVINELLKLDTCADAEGVESSSNNFGVKTITFKNDGHPSGKVGMAYVDDGAIAINLEELWSSCLTALEEGVVKLSMTGIVWHELIKTLLHEIYHIDACREPELRKIIEDDMEAADKEAEELAGEAIIDLVKTLDVEPSPLSDMQFFNVKVMELMTSEMKDEDWVVRARIMLEENIMYHDEDNDITLTSFREYIRGINDPDSENESYEQGTSVIDLIFNMDDGSVVKTAEVLPEPEVEVVEDKAVEAVGAIAEAMIEASVDVVKAVAETLTPVATVPEALGPDDIAETLTPAAALALQSTPIPPETVAETSQELFVPLPAEEESPVADSAFAESVPLPENIAAEQAQVAAAAVAVPSTAPPAMTYTPNGLSAETMVAFLKDVYMRLYTHIFTKCGWQLNSDQGFTNPGAVLEPVSIADLIQLHQAPGLIMEYDTLDANGHLKPEEMKGHIRGLIFSKSNQHGIPAFAIYLNLGGNRVKRSLIAQNPAKITNGQYSPIALEARAGHAITWLFSEDENKKFVAKIRDNIYEAL